MVKNAHANIELLADYGNGHYFEPVYSKLIAGIYKHLQQCFVCAQYVDLVREQKAIKLAWARKEIELLEQMGIKVLPKKYLNGKECPTDMEMAYYVDNALEADKVNIIIKHLEHCDACKSSLFLTRNLHLVKSKKIKVLKRTFYICITDIKPAPIKWSWPDIVKKNYLILFDHAMHAGKCSATEQ